MENREGGYKSAEKHVQALIEEDGSQRCSLYRGCDRGRLSSLLVMECVFDLQRWVLLTKDVTISLTLCTALWLSPVGIDPIEGLFTFS
jgi:hypothetical protein